MASRIKKDKDNGFKAFISGMKELNGFRVKVGVQGRLAAQIHAGGISMVDLMTIHEFGAPNANIPQRAPFRSTADANGDKYRRAEALIVKKLVKKPKSTNVKGELLKLGERVRKDIIDRVRNSEIKQDLAESTKRQRGEDGPALIDTGALMNSIRAVVQ